MRNPPVTLEQLKSLVGTELRYQGLRCTLVEVVDDPPMVVLRPVDAEPVIQPDKFGNPSRHAPPLYELPVFAPDGYSPSAELKLVTVPGTTPPAAR